MSYSLYRVPGEMMVVADLYGKIDPELMMDVYAQSAEIIQQIEHACCHVINFLEAEVLPRDTAEVATIIGAGLTALRQRSAPVFTALVGAEEEMALLAEQLRVLGHRIPTFSTVNQARSYLNLKIDTLNLKESLESHHTQGLDETFRYEQYEEEFDSHRVPESGTSIFPNAGLLRVQAVDLDKSLLLFPDRELILGRRDSGGEKPDADFSFWGGFHNGVSRRHAKVALNERNELVIYDLNSTNGTYINGVRLEPHRPYILHDGDELRLGKLVTRIYYQQAVS